MLSFCGSAIPRAQQPSGLWNPNLDDPDQIPVGEASGSGFFVFGLAWGINTDLPDRATHWPAVERGWTALLGRRRLDGIVGSVQPIGAAPDQFGPMFIQDYGTGAFLLAAGRYSSLNVAFLPFPVAGNTWTARKPNALLYILCLLGLTLACATIGRREDSSSADASG